MARCCPAGEVGLRDLMERNALGIGLNGGTSGFGMSVVVSRSAARSSPKVTLTGEVTIPSRKPGNSSGLCRADEWNFPFRKLEIR